LNTLIDFVVYGAEVKRYHTLTTLQSETVGHHSHGVALLCLLLRPDASRALLIAALLHDLAEQSTGDIPSPAKRELGIGANLEQLEHSIMHGSGWSFPNLTAAEKRTLKLADLAHGALFCRREMQLGNLRMSDVFDRYVSYAEQMILIGEERQLFNTIKELS
jgi:5'-deoxynucleotidase YfbR-like HD superfamily hydrolase